MIHKITRQIISGSEATVRLS